MKTAIIPGSFKPPHYGHYMLVKKLLDDKSIDKIYIIISSKPRYISADDKKTKDKTKDKTKEITAEESEKIWKIYYGKEFNKPTGKRRLYMMVSPMSSPIQMAYAITAGIAKKAGKKDEVILVKSSKDDGNKRFEMFKNLGVKTKIWSLPQFETLSSTNMRRTIYEGNKKNFMKFLPPKLSSIEKNKIWKIWKTQS